MHPIIHLLALLLTSTTLAFPTLPSSNSTDALSSLLVPREVLNVIAYDGAGCTGNQNPIMNVYVGAPYGANLRSYQLSRDLADNEVLDFSNPSQAASTSTHPAPTSSSSSAPPPPPSSSSSPAPPPPPPSSTPPTPASSASTSIPVTRVLAAAQSCTYSALMQGEINAGIDVPACNMLAGGGKRNLPDQCAVYASTASGAARIAGCHTLPQEVHCYRVWSY